MTWLVSTDAKALIGAHIDVERQRVGLVVGVINPDSRREASA